MPRGRKKKEKKIEIPKEKINDVKPNDPYMYDPQDPYGKRLRR